MKKINFNEDQVNDIIQKYVEQGLSLVKIGEIYGVSKATIKLCLTNNNITIQLPGQRFKGGKSSADQRYYLKNKDKISKRYKNWANKNSQQLKEYGKTWRLNNIENVRTYKREYKKNMMSRNFTYKLSQRFKTAIWASIKGVRSEKIFQTLNYTLTDLIKHLEVLFKDGMSWENYGEWHIDHIIPTSKFNYTDIDSPEFKECWSLSNLQPMWAKDNLSKNNKIIAHQYKIRKTKEKEQFGTIGFNPTELSLKNTKIELIDRKVCKKIVEEYEWLGYMPRYTNYHFGIFFEINGEYHLGGVIAYQPEYGENLGVWDKFGYTNKIIQLSRGVCLWWTPKNTASYFINKTLDWLKTNTKYKVVTATVDSSAGEIGVIYQALNWIYVGLFGGNLTKSGKERIRYGYKIGDKIYNQRHIREKIGTAKNEIVLKHFPDVQIINLGRKKRYFQFIGTKLENKELIKAIQDIIKPYPKK